ncbi:hypothetical protein MtrunA17_Chr8g0383651 [Medicago truncatula]|uniref:Uncharacterized protein n=1 Tax=Medicago truncatula TaxID=3880 RepID=A0A396GRA3_MEDTR|nr:hypothetical protein MtrunA17_Chr8g0383651 [Medicago truncatula]
MHTTQHTRSFSKKKTSVSSSSSSYHHHHRQPSPPIHRRRPPSLSLKPPRFSPLCSTYLLTHSTTLFFPLFTSRRFSTAPPPLPLRIRNQPHACHHLLSVEKWNPSSTASPPG